jgi:hypothetical protein
METTSEPTERSRSFADDDDVEDEALDFLDRWLWDVWLLDDEQGGGT